MIHTNPHYLEDTYLSKTYATEVDNEAHFLYIGPGPFTPNYLGRLLSSTLTYEVSFRHLYLTAGGVPAKQTPCIYSSTSLILHSFPFLTHLAHKGTQTIVEFIDKDLYPRNSKWPVTTLVLLAVLPSQARIRLALLVERLAPFEFLRAN